MKERFGLLLINLGTPDAPHPPEVRRYLREFLSDPRVMDIPAPLRFLLLELVILPRRPRSSAEAYQKIWTSEGSPLLVHGRALAEECVRRVAQSGARRIGLHTSESLRAAIHLYEGMGFVRAPAHDFQPDGAELVMAYYRDLV